MAKKFSFNSLLKSVTQLIDAEEVVEKPHTPQQKSHQQEIENSIIVLAAAVIRCDRNFSSSTEKFLIDFLSKQFGTGTKEHRIKSVMGHLDSGTEPYTKIACKELKLLTTLDSRFNIVHFLFGVAAADDFVNAKEARCIQRLAGYLGVSDSDYKELKIAFANKNSPYSVLGLEEDATLEQVKTAYRKMTLKFHPDKRGEGVSESEAGLKFREIKRAFEVITGKSV